MISLNRAALLINRVARSGFPFHLGRPHNEMQWLRRQSVPERLHAKSWMVRILFRLAATLLWPLGALFETRRYSRHLAHPLHEGMRMYVMALLRNVPPKEYIAYRFFEEDRRAHWADYFYGCDTAALLALNRTRNAHNEDVQDKLRFAAICASHDLPFVPTFAGADITVAALPKSDIWLKARHGSAGEAAELWTRANGGFKRNGIELSVENLILHARQRNLLLQPRLRNHAAIEPMTNGSLAALRIITGCDPAGNICLLGNVLTLPQGSSITTIGGAIVAVSWCEGQIERMFGAKDKDVMQQIIGSTVPFFTEAVELVSRAHRLAFSNFVTLGWDVALLADGPVLLETNSGWDVVHPQQLWGPLGRTQLPDILRSLSGSSLKRP